MINISNCIAKKERKRKLCERIKRCLCICVILLVPSFAFAVKAEADVENEGGLAVSDEDGAYLDEFKVDKIIDGTENFDTSDDPADPCYKYRIGNDENGLNGKVRTFDAITYNLSYHVMVSNERHFENESVQFEFLLPLTSKEAIWDTTSMSRMDQGWSIVTEKKSYDFDGDGIKEEVTCQVLKGKKILGKSSVDPTAITGRGTLTAVIKVKGMKNGEKISPVLTAWMEREGHKRKEQITVQAKVVEVTAEPRYNVQLKPGIQAYNQIIGETYDFDIGNAKALDKGNGKVTGTTMGYGITLQLYNDKGKNLKGIELPRGPITFDLELSAAFITAQGEMTEEKNEYVMKNYTPLVLTMGEHKINGNPADGREIGDNRSYIMYGGPENSSSNWNEQGNNKCYQGGVWKASKKDNVISVCVSDYEIDVEKFPNADLGEKEGMSTYFDYKNGVENIGCFSAGMIYILVPSCNNGTTNPKRKGIQIMEDLKVPDGSLQIAVKDMRLCASSLSGQELAKVNDNSNQTGPENDDCITSIICLQKTENKNCRIRYLTKDGFDEETVDKETVDKETADNEITDKKIRDRESTKRKIAGVAWLDENENGQRETEEKFLGGVKVCLLKKNSSGKYEEAIDSAGKKMCAETSQEDGSYSFENLSAGTYGIRFLSGTSKLDKYVSIRENEGDDVPDGGGTEIYDIVLPDKADLTDESCENESKDVGFCYKKGSITLYKTRCLGKKLEGIRFKLEKKETEGEWKTISETETDKNGTAKMEKVSPGIYRIYEIEAVNGEQLPKEPIEVQIPCEMDKKGNTEPSYEENGRYYYLDISYKINNDKVFQLPESGGNGNRKWYLTGLFLLCAGVGYALYIKEKCLYNNYKTQNK